MGRDVAGACTGARAATSRSCRAAPSSATTRGGTAAAAACTGARAASSQSHKAAPSSATVWPWGATVAVAGQAGACAVGRAASSRSAARAPSSTILRPRLAGACTEAQTAPSRSVTRAPSRTTRLVAVGAFPGDTKSTITVKGESTIANNNASCCDGGGLWARGAVWVAGHSSVVGNRAGTNGGGVYGTSKIVIADGATVDGNYAVAHGGGLCGSGAAVDVTAHSTISRNDAQLGGGIAVLQGGRVATSDASVVGNVASTPAGLASARGGGIYMSDGGAKANIVCVRTNFTHNSATRTPACQLPRRLLSSPAACGAFVRSNGHIDHMGGYNINETCTWEVQCSAGAGRVRVRVGGMQLEAGRSFLTITSGAGGRARRGSGAELVGEAVDVDGANALVELSTPGVSDVDFPKPGGFSASLSCCEAEPLGAAIYAELGGVALDQSEFGGSFGAGALFLLQPRALRVQATAFANFSAAATVRLSEAPLADCTSFALPCPVGSMCTYANYSLWCTPCEPNQYSPLGVACAACPSGRAPAPGGGACAPCSPGSAGTDGRCARCDAGRAAPAPSMSACAACGVGMASPAVVRTRCVACAPGRQQAAGGAAPCEACPLGKASSAATICTACPSDRGQAPSSNRTVCVDCAVGPHRCEMLRGISCSAREFEVPPTPDSRLAKCKDLPCIDCAGSATRVARHWRPSSHGVFLECPNPVACPGTDNGSVCGSGYRGLLCTRCAPGYRRIGKNRCAQVTKGSCAVTYGLGGMCGLLFACLTARGLLWLCSTGASARLDRWSACSRLAIDVDIGSDGTRVQNPLDLSLTEDSGVRGTEQPRARRQNASCKLTGRLLWTSARVVISLFQIVGQLGSVLHFEFPPAIQNAIGAACVFALEVSSVVHAECLPGVSANSPQRFYMMWWFTVVLLPLCLMGGAAVYCTLAQVKSWRTPTSLVLYLVYPIQCTAAFSLFNCRQLGPGKSLNMLAADSIVPCSGVAYSVHVCAAAVATVAVAVVPLWFLHGMTRSAEEAEEAEEQSVARLAAKQQGIDETVARQAMRDVGRNQRFSFLTAGYQPSHTFWESVDMSRKFTIIGLASLFGKGSVEQLFFTSFLSLAWLVVHVKEWPYHFAVDNWLKLSSELAIFGTIVVAMVHHTSTAHHSSMFVYDATLMVIYFGLVPACTVAACASKLLRVRARVDGSLDEVGAAFVAYGNGMVGGAERELLQQYFYEMSIEHQRSERHDPFRLLASQPNGTFVVFLSHFKAEASAPARMIKTALSSSLGLEPDSVFLDSDNLTFLDALMQHVRDSLCFVVLLSKGYITRPFCLMELECAIECGRPLLFVSIVSQYDPRGMTTDDALRFLQNTALDDDCVEGIEASGRDVSQLTETICSRLAAHAEQNGSREVKFAADASANILRARCHELAACVKDLLCVKAAPSLLTRARGRGRTDSVGGPGLGRVYSWQTKRRWAAAVSYATDVATEVTASLFGQRLDQFTVPKAGQHTMLHEMLGVGRDAVLDIGSLTQADAVSCMADYDVLLFFQSKAALFDADVLTQVFWCSKRGVPIVPVTLTDGEAAFDFLGAQRIISNLEVELERHSEGLSAIVANRCRTKDLRELQATLSTILRTISRPMSLSQESQAPREAVQQAQLEQVVAAMMQCADSGADHQAILH